MVGSKDWHTHILCAGQPASLCLYSIFNETKQTCTLLVTSWPGLVLHVAHITIHVTKIIKVKESLVQIVRFNVNLTQWGWWCLTRQNLVKCFLHWQSEAKQGGSQRDSQECVETDRERSVLFVQVCVRVCELHPPRLWVTWRDRNVVPVKAFFKVRKQAGTSNKQKIFSAASSALFSFYCWAPLPGFFNAVSVDLFPTSLKHLTAFTDTNRWRCLWVQNNAVLAGNVVMSTLIGHIKEVDNFPSLSCSTVVELVLGWKSRSSLLTTQVSKSHAKCQLMLCNLQKQGRVLCDFRW